MFDFDDDWKDDDPLDFADDHADSEEDGFGDADSDDFDPWGEKKHGGTSVNDLVGSGVIPVDWNKLP